ncbi:MAG TPA: SDR family NAD(P)-dependent oxidoreductase [Puia sp.]|nr:SDR family NAD(P)-dependent oxidoreductase [Puia sp.]
MKINKFSNKVCLITGASSGIGAALAQSLNSMGATVILSARNRENLENVKANCRYPEKISILECDMEKTESLPAFTLEAWNLFHGIDYVFLNAGMAVRDMIVNTDLAMVQKVMNINFISNVVLSRELLAYMRSKKQGCFVVTSSLCGKFGIPKLGAYSASKHALHGFFESLRAEYECDGIKVTMVTAGLVRTNITLNALKGNGTIYGKMQDSIAAGISPEACARGIIKAVAKGKCEVLVGAIEIYSVLIKRFFPGLLRMAITKHPMKKLRNAGLLPNPLNPFTYSFKRTS